MSQGTPKNDHIPALVAHLVAFLAMSVFIYLFNPLKGLSWALIYVLQAFSSFFVYYHAVYKKHLNIRAGVTGFRLTVLRHLIYQVLLFFAFCLVGFAVKELASGIVGSDVTIFGNAAYSAQSLVSGDTTFADLLSQFKSGGPSAFITPCTLSGLFTLIACLLLAGVSHFIVPRGYVFHNDTPGKYEQKLLAIDIYLYVFFISVTALVMLGSVFSIYPFGDSLYLRMDCYHQYLPFVKEFWRRMHNGEGLFFAWENGLGVNYWAHYAYYLTSITNIFTLLVPEKFIPEAVEAGMVLKGALAGVSFLYYMQSRFHKKEIVQIPFALFYALSAFFLAYSCNIMWPDVYLLFPLLMLGTERIAKGGSAKLYGIALVFSIYANFYIAAIAGIAIVLYFIANMIIYAEQGDFLRKIGRFMLSTVLACMIGAVILLPVYLCLKATAAGESSFPQEWTAYFPFYELYERMLVNATTIQNDSYLPNIYSSLLALFFLPLYFCNRKIALKRKITKGILVLFLLFSFQWNVFAYVWHGLHFPNSFPARHSFFFVFLMVSMAYECFRKRAYIHRAAVVISSTILLSLCIILGILLSRDNMLNLITTYMCSVLILAVYGVIFFTERKMKENFFKGLFISVTLLEILSNTFATGINSVVVRSEYVQDDDVMQEALSYLSVIDHRFYRVEELDRRFMNEAAWDGYNGASYFSSTASGGVLRFYDAMGMRYSTVAYSYQGAVLPVTSILGIKYLISDTDEPIGPTFTKIAEVGDHTGVHLSGTGNKSADTDLDDTVLRVYENKYPLSIGFGIPADANDKFVYEEVKRPFTNSTNLVTALLEEDENYSDRAYYVLPVNDVREDDFEYGKNGAYSISGKGTIYKIPAGVHPYFYVVNFVDDIRIIEQDADGNYLRDRKETDLKFRHIIDLGYYDETRIVTFVCEDDPEEQLGFHAYCLDQGTYVRLMHKLSADQLDVQDYSSTYLRGAINASRDEVLFFSIPYDEGFTVYVDGEKTETSAFSNAFLTVPITKGEHKIELKYVPPGFIKGLIVSLAGLFFAALWVIIDRILRKRKKSVKQTDCFGWK